MASPPSPVLHSVSWGNGPALTLAHGFTQNAGTWGRFGELLGIQHRVRAVDLPGHGGSTGIHGDLPTSAALLGAADIPSDYLGYSLGGRVALHLAVAHPERVARLVLIGSTGGIDDPALREARRATDEALADELDAGLALDAFLDRWLTQPLFRSLPEEASQRDARARNTTAGLAASLRECGTGTQTPLWDQLASIRRPVLVVAGALDVRFTVLGRRLVNALDPHHEGFARLALVPGAGHACHLERPELTARLVNAFLA